MNKIKIEGFEMYLRGVKDLFGYHLNRYYEPEETALIKQLVKPDWVCMDIGANIGYFTILMARQCKHVYAFEPEPSNFEMLKQNVALSDIDVTIYREAVGNKNGTMPLYLSDSNNGMHRLYKSKWCNERTDTYVYCTQLDEYKFSKINLIKMDIEGAEYGALIGMVELLIKDHPIIIMEFHPMSIIEYGVDPEKVYEFLNKLGYRISLIPNNEPLTYTELYMLTNDESGGRNILCR
jgi:methyltransferase, FkbM family